MTQFNVGDKVRALSGPLNEDGERYGLKIHGEYRVAERAVDGQLRLDPDPGSRQLTWTSKRFELVEPAEIEQATAILDTVTTEDGWWDIDLNIVNAQRVVDNAEPFGLEVRVQVRRKVVGA